MLYSIKTFINISIWLVQRCDSRCALRVHYDHYNIWQREREVQRSTHILSTISEKESECCMHIVIRAGHDPNCHVYFDGIEFVFKVCGDWSIVQSSRVSSRMAILRSVVATYIVIAWKWSLISKLSLLMVRITTSLLSIHHTQNSYLKLEKSTRTFVLQLYHEWSKSGWHEIIIHYVP